MKRLSILLFGLALLTSAYRIDAQTASSAQKVFDSMIEALGGKVYLDVKEIQVTGRYFTFRRDEINGSEPFLDYIKFPDLERTEFGKEKEKRVEIHRGTEGW